MFLKLITNTLIVGLISGLSHGAQAKKKYGGSIKLELTSPDRGTVIDIQKAGSLGQGSDQGTVVPSQNLHISIGYVDKSYDKKTASLAGQLAVNFLNTYLANHPIVFEIDQCQNFTGQTMNFTILRPTAQSAQDLKALNLALEQELNRNGYSLNNLTTNIKYTPHLTIKKGIPNSTKPATGHNRLSSMNNKIAALPQAKKSFVVKRASFSLGW